MTRAIAVQSNLHLLIGDVCQLSVELFIVLKQGYRWARLKIAQEKEILSICVVAFFLLLRFFGVENLFRSKMKFYLVICSICL